ncbi:MAG: LapA family protein [Rhizonema sp. PD37]|nr:LapA family protein [Rhizonema sp. PD37]
MAVIRLFLLVGVMGSLTLLLVQNWSPVLPLTFLGMRTQSLPLALWILFSTAAGTFTSLLIASLFKLSNYFVGQQRQTSLKSSASNRSANSTSTREPIPRTQASQEPTSKTQNRASNASDDWDIENSQDDDWDFEESKNAASTPNSQNTRVNDSKTNERQQDSKSSSKSSSAYSYGYQEPKDSGVGKTESVYDADYRVIVPPHQPPTTNQAEDDDWGFFDDDDSEKDKRSR